MPILNYSTVVDANESMAAIQKMLVKTGANRMMIDYEGELPVALVFQIDNRPFRLPCRYQAILKILQADKSIHHKSRKTPDQALRVAWRILKDWVEAQLALVQTEMVNADEVFLPYLVMNQKGETAYDIYTRNDKMLPLKND